MSFRNLTPEKKTALKKFHNEKIAELEKKKADYRQEIETKRTQRKAKWEQNKQNFIQKMDRRIAAEDAEFDIRLLKGETKYQQGINEHQSTIERIENGN